MAGCVIDATPIAVDFWKPTKAPQVRLFFLTHLHSDHTEGLTSSWRLPIYTSSISARLLKKRFKLPESIVRELEVGQSYLIPLDEGNNTIITVTVLDANHVPGSVMFLFQGYFGNILYCGDMRWDPQMLEDPLLQDVVQQRKLDVLYLDNTYSAPFCQFPSREEAKQEIFRIIDSYPDHEIKIGMNNLGREKLLEDIALRYGERILVSQDKYEELQLLECLDVFTTNPELSRIHTVPKKQIQVASHKKWNEKYQTISIIPSALYVGWKNGPYSSQASNGLHVIPYSDHSSYSELMEMVSQLAPHQIIPIVKYWAKNGWWNGPSAPDQNLKADMTVYRHLLSLPPPDPVVIPDDVIKVMDSKAPRLLQTQPRRCVLRHGLSPIRSKSRGVIYSSPRSSSSTAMSYTPSATPTSLTTLESSRSDVASPRRADQNTSSRLLKHGIKFRSYNVRSNTKNLLETSTNEILCGHGPNEIHLEKNTPTHISGSHKNHHAPSCTRISASMKNNTGNKQQPREHIEPSAKRVLSMESPRKHTEPSARRVLSMESPRKHIEPSARRVLSMESPIKHIQSPARRVLSMESPEHIQSPTRRVLSMESPEHSESPTRRVLSMESPEHSESPAKRGLSMELPEEISCSEVEVVNLKKKRKSKEILSTKRDALLRETVDFITRKNGEMNSDRTCSTKDELSGLVKDANLILESLSCLDYIL